MVNHKEIDKLVFDYNMNHMPKVIYTASGNEKNLRLYKIQKGVKGMIPTKIICKTYSEVEECAKQLNKKLGIDKATYNAMVYCCLFGFNTFSKSLQFYKDLDIKIFKRKNLDYGNI